MSSILTFDLLPEETCVFSATSATAGDHVSLDYIPGSAIRGWVASQLYRQIAAADAWELFHSGNVVFSDGYPLSPEGAIGLPEACSLHRLKAAGQTEPLYNLSRFDEDQLTGQPVQLRLGYRTLSGGHFDVARERTLRTAIKAGTDRALTSSLYGYEGIAAGQRFRIFIRLSQASLKLADQVTECMSGKTILLGRSKSAEYGSMSTSVPEATELAVQEEATEALLDGTVCVWLCSDMDPGGEMNAADIQTGTLFGLNNAKMLAGKSFLRTVDSIRYNAAAGTHEAERRLLARGSVLTYALTAAQERPVSDMAGFQICGDGNEIGRGLYILQPAILSTKTLQQVSLETGDAAMNAEDTALSTFLKTSRRAGDADDTEIEQLRQVLIQAYRSAALMNRSLSGILSGPTPSQWSKLMGAAKASEDSDSLRKRVSKAIADPESELTVPRWSAEFLANGKVQTFAKLIEVQLDSLHNQSHERQVRFVVNLSKTGGEVARSRQGRTGGSVDD